VTALATSYSGMRDTIPEELDSVSAGALVPIE
jgi:hypothetical protein